MKLYQKRVILEVVEMQEEVILRLMIMIMIYGENDDKEEEKIALDEDESDQRELTPIPLPELDDLVDVSDEIDGFNGKWKVPQIKE